jgi:hypothetical protein
VVFGRQGIENRSVQVPRRRPQMSEWSQVHGSPQDNKISAKIKQGMITILLIIGFAIIFILGKRSGYGKPVSPDLWKPIDDMIPNLSRFRDLDPETYTRFERELESAKKEMISPDVTILKGISLERSGMYLRRAVDEFSSLAGSLPSGDSIYHDEISELAASLAITGERVLVNAAEETKQSFTPRILNALIE